MSADVLDAKKLRLERIKREFKEDDHEAKSSVSNFMSCYNVVKKGSNGEDNVQKETEKRPSGCFSVTFDQSDENDNGDNAKEFKEKASKTLYDSLTEKVRSKLESLEAMIQEGEDEDLDLNQIDQAMNEIRFVTREPWLEFDDFSHLKNYNLPLARLNSGGVPLLVSHQGRLAFNNLTSIVMLSVDLPSKSSIFKSIYKPKEGELLTCVYRGSDRFSEVLITAGTVDNSIVFIDLRPDQPDVVFRLSVDNLESIPSVIGIANISDQLFVLLEDFTVQVFNVVYFKQDWFS